MSAMLRAFRRKMAIGRGVSADRVEAIEIHKAFEIDLLVEGCIIIELKSIEAVLPKHHAQLLTYLKLAGCKLGFLMNFNEAVIKDGIRRKIL